MMSAFDVVVIGGGVIGLAHAYAAARHLGPAGKVAIIERNVYAQGASIRNFGMLWPVGQPIGYRRDIATKSRDIWHGLLKESGIWHLITPSPSPHRLAPYYPERRLAPSSPNNTTPVICTYAQHLPAASALRVRLQRAVEPTA